MNNSQHSFLFRKCGTILLVLFSLQWQSCIIAPEKYIMASMDVSHRKYKGPSPGYEHLNDTEKDDFGFNMCALFITALAGNPQAPKSYNAHSNPSRFYASTANDHSWYYDYRNDPPLTVRKPDPPFDVKENLRVMWGLEFVNRRCKNVDKKVRMNYLRLPIYGIYQRPLGPGRIFGGMGPFFAYGFGGKTIVDGDEYKTFDKDDGYKRFDAGIGFRVGYNMEAGYAVALAYDLGLANLDRTGNGNKTKTRGFSINIGSSLDKLLKRK